MERGVTLSIPITSKAPYQEAGCQKRRRGDKERKRTGYVRDGIGSCKRRWEIAGKRREGRWTEKRKK